LHILPYPEDINFASASVWIKLHEWKRLGRESAIRDLISEDGRTIMLRLCVVVAAALCLPVYPASSSEYPTRPITLVVPFSAGGSTDTIARIMGEHMSKTLGQPIIIENVPGAGGTTAMRRAAHAPADGYTIIMGHMGTHGAAPAQYSDLKYDPITDFTPIGLTAGLPVVIATRKDFPANTLREFVDYVKKHEGKVNEGHAGVGSLMHTTCTLLQSIIDSQTTRVAYRGSTPAINDLIGGSVDFSCIAVMVVIGQIQAGMLKPIAIASRQRLDVIGDVPTTAEGGLPEFQVSAWNALFAPKKLPGQVQAKLNDALNKTLEHEGTRKRFLEMGAEMPDKAHRTPQFLQALVESEVNRWSAVLKPTQGKKN
jgi:tripartite-type tricarboxylate transporter receptor subunit TctC